MRRALLVLASIPIAVAIACSGSDDAAVGDGDGDGGDDGGGDGAAPADGQSDAPADGSPIVVTYGDPADSKNWSFFDFGNLYPTSDAAPSTLPSGFLGAIFDGHYIYYVPNGNKTAGADAFDIVRFDTTAPFEATTSFEKSSTANLGANAAFVGGTFADGFVYFAPYGGVPFLRYDTSGVFGDGGGFQALGSAPTISFGAAYANQAVLYAPLGTPVTRFDLLDAGFTTFAPGTLDAGATGYEGVAFDGKYAYFSPEGASPVTGNSSKILRVDTTADFTNAASWSVFDTHDVDPASGIFGGTVYDGRYVYFVPTRSVAATIDARFVRYDTTGSFSDKASWSVYAPMDDASITGYHTAGFDGRYVYYLPFVMTGTSLLLRYDTTASFGDSSSWTYFAMDTFHPGATGFEGMTFDGRYMYFVPRYGHIGARFDARNPPGLPPGFHGSFL